MVITFFQSSKIWATIFQFIFFFDFFLICVLSIDHIYHMSQSQHDEVVLDDAEHEIDTSIAEDGSIPAAAHVARGAAKKHRAWMFTSFLDREPNFPCSYIVYQREKCPTSGRLHYQGYTHFENGRTFIGVKRLDPTAHWEPRRGTHEEARAYCTKLDTRVPGTNPSERGTAPRKGARNDLTAICEAVRAGATDHDLADTMPEDLLKFGSGINRLRMACTPKRKWKTKVIILHGEPGCGKSRWAHEMFPNAYTKDPTQWWDGYCGEQVVIFDEFYGQLKHEYMLKLMDRYDLRLEVKGGYTQFACKLLIFTSNTDPIEWYRGLSERTDKQGRDRPIKWEAPFFRRVDHVYRYNSGHWERATADLQFNWGEPRYERCALPTREILDTWVGGARAVPGELELITGTAPIHIQ